MAAEKSTPSIQQDKKKCVRIDSRMIPAKLTYFFNGGFLGSLKPFYNLFYISLGLSATQAGLISGISLAVSSVSGPLWGSLADRTGYRRLIFIIVCIGAATTVFPMPWVAEAVGKYDNNTCRTNQTATNSSNISNCLSRHLVNSADMFSIMLALTIISRMFFVGLPAYIEGIQMNVIKNSIRRTNYGAQRVFFAIGFATFNTLAGVCIDHYKHKYFSKYTAGFFVFLFCILALVPIGYILVGQTRWEEADDTEGTDKRKIFAQVITVCKKLDSIIFLLTVVVSGFGDTVLQGFMFMLLNDYTHASTTAMTLLVLVCVVSELILYTLSSKIITLLGGPIPCIVIGVFSYFPRYMLMSYISNPWWMLPVQLVHGVGLGLSWTAQMEYSYKIFPPEIKMTGISIVSSIHTVATASIAHALGGFIYTEYGGRWLFRGTGILCGIWSIFIAFYHGIKRRTEKGSTQVIPTCENNVL